MADSRELGRPFMGLCAPGCWLFDTLAILRHNHAANPCDGHSALFTRYTNMSHTLPVGGILRDRYEIIDLVGQGGMGAVYKADDLRLRGRICAVKEILPELISAPGMEDQAHD